MVTQPAAIRLDQIAEVISREFKDKDVITK